MSMILSASVIRVRDGLPLSASTDYEQGTGMQECRKYFKMLSRKLAQLPDRCALKTGRYNINSPETGTSNSFRDCGIYP
uniref:SEC22 homolog A, vesicle trafficking protein n=1 Tax=Ovis aries TaxID=9940 RepID=A0AC11EG78_SHEEP